MIAPAGDLRLHSTSQIAFFHSSSSLRLWRPSRSLPPPRHSVSVVCQMESSHNGSVTLQKQSSLLNAVGLQQQDELLRKGAVGTKNRNRRLQRLLPEKLSILPEKLSILQAKDDCYDGVIVDPSSLPCDVEAFIDCLRASLLQWRSQNKKGVWLKLPTKNADFIPVAIKEGFQYHHAEPSYVMMTCWLADSPSTLPPNASHPVGIGAFVVNDCREVLVVQEKTGPLSGLGVWKMPTGLINQGEDLCLGAVREVKEETGVDTEFVEVVAFRHGYYASLDKSDLYFLCVLRPLSLEIVEQDGEIEAAKWMPLEQFQNQPFHNENSIRKKMIDLCVASFERQYKGFKAVRVQHGSKKYPSHYFFHEDH